MVNMATMRYIADLQHEKLWDGKKEEEMSKFNAIGCKKKKPCLLADRPSK